MAFYGAAPRTQYDRNLTIKLTGGGPDVVFTFPIKPSEFNSETPARVTTTQTLQGVYQDFGGLGVQSLSYQGSTGWRRRALNNFMDGFECFQTLYEKIYLEYHKRISASSDPNDIQCLVIDDLYDKVYVVSLDDFRASKSKSSPLLYNYTIPMTVQSSSDNGRLGADLSDVSVPSTALNPDYAPVVLVDALNGVYLYDPGVFRQYVVQSGDSMQSIAYQFFGTTDKAKDIADANSIAPPYVFDPGLVLVIPW